MDGLTPCETALSALFGTDAAGREAGMTACAVMEQEVARARSTGDLRAAGAIAALLAGIYSLAAVQAAEEREAGLG
jgi:hypothetical protein